MFGACNTCGCGYHECECKVPHAGQYTLADVIAHLEDQYGGGHQIKLVSVVCLDEELVVKTGDASHIDETVWVWSDGRFVYNMCEVVDK